MKHPVEHEEVMAYLDGELEAGRAAGVELHLEECAECSALAADLRGVSQKLASWQVERAPARLASRVLEAAEPKPRPPIGRWVLNFAAVAAIFLVIGAISVPNLLRSRSAADQANEAARRRMAAVQDKEPGSRAVPPSQMRITGRTQAAEPAAPMIIKTAALALITKEFENARAAIEDVVRRHQGYIANLSTSGQPGAGRSLSATLRIPAARLDAALGELKKLGRVEAEQQSGEEVTQQYVDLVARLNNARNTEQRLIEVLRERTGKVGDILAVEKEIARVRMEIEQMDAQRKSLENQVSFATLSVRLSEERKAEIGIAPPSTLTRLWNEMVGGYDALVESAVGLLAFLLRYGPSLAFWVLVVYVPVRLAWKRLKPVTSDK